MVMLPPAAAALSLLPLLLLLPPLLPPLILLQKMLRPLELLLHLGRVSSRWLLATPVQVGASPGTGFAAAALLPLLQVHVCVTHWLLPVLLNLLPCANRTHSLLLWLLLRLL
jgi:hypothetical protein